MGDVGDAWFGHGGADMMPEFSAPKKKKKKKKKRTPKSKELGTALNAASAPCKTCQWYVEPPHKQARICSACNVNPKYSNRFEQRT